MKKMAIGKVAKICNVNIDTIRYYERIHLIPPPSRTDTGYRMFDEKTTDLIKFIKNAQHIGFSLDEIKSLISLSQSEESDCGDISKIASQKLQEVEERIHNLHKVKESLYQLIQACPGKGAPLNECSILDSLNKDIEPVKKRP